MNAAAHDGPTNQTGPHDNSPANPTGSEWLARFSARLGVEPPDDDTVEQLLELAGVAAHASERIAAPIACWLIGRSGLDPAEAIELARNI